MTVFGQNFVSYQYFSELILLDYRIFGGSVDDDISPVAGSNTVRDCFECVPSAVSLRPSETYRSFDMLHDALI